jgi:hypothetical protein
MKMLTISAALMAASMGISASEAAAPPPPCDDPSIVLELTDKFADGLVDQVLEKVTAALTRAINAPPGFFAFDPTPFSSELKKMFPFLKFREIARNDHEAKCVAVGDEKDLKDSDKRSLLEAIGRAIKIQGKPLPDAAIKQLVDDGLAHPGSSSVPKMSDDVEYTLVRNAGDQYHVKVFVPDVPMPDLAPPAAPGSARALPGLPGMPQAGETGEVHRLGEKPQSWWSPNSSMSECVPSAQAYGHPSPNAVIGMQEASGGKLPQVENNGDEVDMNVGGVGQFAVMWYFFRTQEACPAGLQAYHNAQ